MLTKLIRKVLSVLAICAVVALAQAPSPGPVNVSTTGNGGVTSKIASGNCVAGGSDHSLQDAGGPCVVVSARYVASMGTGSLANGSCAGIGSSVFAAGTGTSVVAASFSGAASLLTPASLNGINITSSFSTDTKVIQASVCNNSGSTWTYTGLSVNFLVD